MNVKSLSIQRSNVLRILDLKGGEYFVYANQTGVEDALYMRLDPVNVSCGYPTVCVAGPRAGTVQNSQPATLVYRAEVEITATIKTNT